jgi:hypothetical protein
MDSILSFYSLTGSTGFKGNKSGMFFFLPKVNGFHQFLPEIDEDKKYPDIPVNPV